MVKLPTKSLLPAALVAGLAMVAPAVAETIELGYVVEVAGTMVMKAAYSAEIESGSFESSLFGKTAGMSDMFSGYKMNWSATGLYDEGQFSPQSYENTRKKKSKKAKSTGINWQPNGAVLLSTGAAPPTAVLAALKGPSSDPLTAILKMASAQTKKPCSGKFRVYDGKDVYDLSLSFKKKITLAGATGQPGLECGLTSTPIAGRAVEKGEDKPDSYGLILAPLKAGGQTLHIPVRITGSTKGLNVTVSAHYVKVDGQPVAAALQ